MEAPLEIEMGLTETDVIDQVGEQFVMLPEENLKSNDEEEATILSRREIVCIISTIE